MGGGRGFEAQTSPITSLPPCPPRPRRRRASCTVLWRRPRGCDQHIPDSHADGGARPTNFLPRASASHKASSLALPSTDPLPLRRPAYLAWCWRLPAPRTHEAGSLGTAPRKSRLSTRGDGSRRGSALSRKPSLPGGSAGRGSAGCPPPGALLSRPPAAKLCGGRRGRGWLATGRGWGRN